MTARTARCRACASSPRPSTTSPAHPQARREGAAPRVQRRRARRSACPNCSRRSATAAARSSSSTATTASAARSSCRTIGESTSTIRCSRTARVARARERAGRVLRSTRAARLAPRPVAPSRLPAAVERAGHLRRRLAHHAHRVADGGDPRRRRGRIDLGILAVALTLPGVLVALAGGGWVDRHRRRPVLIGTDLVRAVALARFRSRHGPGCCRCRCSTRWRRSAASPGAVRPGRSRLHHRPRRPEAAAGRQRQARGARLGRRDFRSRARRRAGRVADGAVRDRRRRGIVRRVGASRRPHRDARSIACAAARDFGSADIRTGVTQHMAQPAGARALSRNGNADVRDELHGVAVHALRAHRTAPVADAARHRDRLRRHRRSRRRGDLGTGGGALWRTAERSSAPSSSARRCRC